MSAIVHAITGGPPKESAAVKAAQKRQEQSLRTQTAIQKRQQLDADKQEEKLSGDLAAQRRAVAARRKTRGGLAFGGSSPDLKTSLGG